MVKGIGFPFSLAKARSSSRCISIGIAEQQYLGGIAAAIQNVREDDRCTIYRMFLEGPVVVPTNCALSLILPRMPNNTTPEPDACTSSKP
jgi:hypothetical protein